MFNVGQASRLSPSLPEAGQQVEEVADRRDACPTRLDALLFGETQSRVVITTKALDALKVIERAKLLGVPATRLGTVGGEHLKIKTSTGELTWGLPELHDLWWNAIAKAMR